MAEYNVKKLNPVIFTGNAGGDYHASNNPNVPESHEITVALPNGAKVVSAWYTPYHNITALDAFAMIAVGRLSNTQVKLQIAGYPGTNERLRITICVLYSM